MKISSIRPDCQQIKMEGMREDPEVDVVRGSDLIFISHDLQPDFTAVDKQMQKEVSKTMQR